MQTEGQKFTNTETSIQNAAHLLQWTLPIFAKLFSTNSLPCLSSVGYQLHDPSVTTSQFFKRRGFCAGQFVFYGLSIVPFE